MTLNQKASRYIDNLLTAITNENLNMIRTIYAECEQDVELQDWENVDVDLVKTYDCLVNRANEMLANPPKEKTLKTYHVEMVEYKLCHTANIYTVKATSEKEAEQLVRKADDSIVCVERGYQDREVLSMEDLKHINKGDGTILKLISTTQVQSENEKKLEELKQKADDIKSDLEDVEKEIRNFKRRVGV